jgi:hypothetical protein
MKVNDSFEKNDIQKCLRVTKVAFDTYTEHTNASLSKILWSSKVTEGKAGAGIVDKIKQCLPALTLEYKTSRGLHGPDDREITDFGAYILDTLAVMVEPKQKEIFYEPPRLDHTGRPIQPKNQLAVDPVDKVKFMAERPLKEGRSGMAHIAKPKLYAGNKSMLAKLVRKEGRLAKVQVAESPDVGKVIKQRMGLAKEDARKVLPRIPVVIKIKSSLKSSTRIHSSK